MNTCKLISLAGAFTLATALSACGSTPTHQQVGIGTGAVLGGVAGHVLTDSTIGTVGGAAVGGLIGNEVTKPKK